MTGRVRVFASLLTVAFVAAPLLLAIPVAAPPPIPMRVQGQAFDRAGTPLSIATPIRAFVDGVDVEDPFGAHASDTRTVSLTRQSSLAIAVAVLIAIVLGLFLLFASSEPERNPCHRPDRRRVLRSPRPSCLRSVPRRSHRDSHRTRKSVPDATRW